jgi:hypothetical protein
MRKGLSLSLFVVLSAFMLNGCKKKKPPVDEFSSLNETVNISEGTDMTNANLTAESAPEAVPDLTATTPAAGTSKPSSLITTAGKKSSAIATTSGTKPLSSSSSVASATVSETPKLVGKSSNKPTPEQIQTALKNAGYYFGPVDGKLGRTTEAAVETFQASNDLKPDGKVGPKTWELLSKHLKKSSKSKKS